MEITIEGRDFQTLVMQLQTRGVKFKIGNAPTRIILEEGWDPRKVTAALEVVGLADTVSIDHEHRTPCGEDIMHLVRSEGPLKTSEIAEKLDTSYDLVCRELKALLTKTPVLTHTEHYKTHYWMTESTLLEDKKAAYKCLTEYGPMPMSTFVNFFAREYDRTDARYTMSLISVMKADSLTEWDYDPREMKVLLHAIPEDSV